MYEMDNNEQAGKKLLDQLASEADLKGSLNKALIHPGSKPLRQLEELLAPVRELAKKLQPYIFSVQQISSKLQPALSALQEIEIQFRPHALAISEGLRRFESFRVKFVKQHEREKLALPPFFHEFTLPEIYELFGECEGPAVLVYQEVFSKRENIDAILESWSKNKFYEDRLPILRDALGAHLEGKHTLSIPTLLAQFEGILCEMLNVRDHGKAKGKIGKIPFKKYGATVSSFANVELIAQAITEQVLLSTNEDHEMEYPNRHRVLHGSNPFYYRNKFASLRCILLVDLLRLDEFLEFDEHHPSKFDETPLG